MVVRLLPLQHSRGPAHQPQVYQDLDPKQAGYEREFGGRCVDPYARNMGTHALCMQWALVTGHQNLDPKQAGNEREIWARVCAVACADPLDMRALYKHDSSTRCALATCIV